MDEQSQLAWTIKWEAHLKNKINRVIISFNKDQWVHCLQNCKLWKDKKKSSDHNWQEFRNNYNFWPKNIIRKFHSLNKRFHHLLTWSNSTVAFISRSNPLSISFNIQVLRKLKKWEKRLDKNFKRVYKISKNKIKFWKESLLNYRLNIK